MDITQRKKIEAELQESEEKFRALVEHSLDGILILDFQGNILFANHTAGKIIDAPDPDEIIGTKNVLEFILPSSHQNVIEDFSNVARGIDGYIAQYQVLTIHGEERWIESIGKTILFEGNPSILISIRDISGRKQVEDELRRTSSELHQIFINMINAFVIWDSVFDATGMFVSFRFRYFNDAFAKMTNLRLEDVKGKNVFEIWPDTEQTWVDTYGRIALTGTPQVFDMYHEPTKGWYHCNAYRPSDTPDRVCAIFEDITERRMKEDALHLTTKKLQLLSGITRHDIINQISVLDGCLDIIQSDCTGPVPKHCLSNMSVAVDQITAMIRFTQEYEQIGVQIPVWKNLRMLVQNAGLHFRNNEIRLENDIPDNIEIFTDPLIQKVFFNLIENTIRHGGRATSITFSHEWSDHTLTILCEDDGKGVAPEFKERIFEKGFGANTGFGLYISREILDITGITITECGEQGKGAKFDILVPPGKFRRKENNFPPI